jgi:NitT/TauT family transport system substrate-binding protein
MHRRISALAAIAAVALVSVVLAGCGSGSSSTSSSSTNSATTTSSASTEVTVGVGTGAYALGLTGQYFSSNGLTIKKEQLSSPAQVTPLLLNGQLQFAAADPIGTLVAISQGVPLVMIGVATSSGTDTSNDSTGVLVQANGPIKSAKDLDGQTLAVSAIEGSAQLSAEAAIDELGGDSSTVKFVEVAPQSMNASVGKGTVAGAVTQEPGITLGKSAGLTDLFAPAGQSMPDSPLIVYVTTKSYAEQNPSVVAAFVKSLTAASKALQGDPSLVRSNAEATYHLTPAQAKEMVLPKFVPTTISKPKMEKVMSLMLKYNLLEAPVDLNTAIYSAK